MELARDVYNVTLEKYQEGVSTSQELTQTHNQYLTAQSGYITAKSELLNAKNKIDKLLENYWSVPQAVDDERSAIFQRGEQRNGK